MKTIETENKVLDIYIEPQTAHEINKTRFSLASQENEDFQLSVTSVYTNDVIKPQLEYICKAVNNYDKLVNALDKAQNLIYKAYMKSFNSHLGETAKAFNERWEAFNQINGTTEIHELLNSLKD